MESPADAALRDRDHDSASLLRRAAAGDRDALASIVAGHDADMARVAFVVCGDRDVTRDAVQNAWLRAATRLGQVREPHRLRAWLCSVAANEARQAMRGRRITLPLTALDHHPAPGASAVELMDLAAALNRLSIDDRALVALRYVAGFRSDELARHFRLTPAGVRTRTKRLLDRLRTELDR